MRALDSTILALVGQLAPFFTPFSPPIDAGTANQGPAPAGVAYYDPTLHGGSMLNDARDGYGEPLNIIVSGSSAPEVLTNDGIVNYARAIGFSEECFGIHLGSAFAANLGDRNEWVNQTIELRQDYGNAGVGTCLESLIGGNHFRVYRQNGPLANSGALFLAVSKEEPVTENHDVVPDGYNIGRDSLATGAIGTHRYGDVTYYTQAENITGLLAPGSEGVNHGIAQDGIVTLLTVTIV